MEETEKKRGISQRCQSSSDVGNEKDEKTDNVRFSDPALISPQDRPNHHHGGSCCSHPGGQKGAYQQQNRIHQGSSLQRSFDDYAAGNREESPEQNDKRDIIYQDDLEDLVPGDSTVYPFHARSGS